MLSFSTTLYALVDNLFHAGLLVHLPLLRESTTARLLGKGETDRMTFQHSTRQSIIDRLSDLKSYPNEDLPPYEEFSVGDKTYYFTSGGSLYQMERKTKEEAATDEWFG
jgi:hypothetical protein